MLHRIAHTISLHDLLHTDALHLTALSGGADSVALLLALRELGYRIEAAHCNFTLRGEESMRDEMFCRELCQRLGIPLHTIRFNTLAEAGRTGESIEMAARRLRYDWFRHLTSARKMGGVCVAHHRDDNVETLLLNLVRGTGLAGLTGMEYSARGVIRPMLDVTRADILSYLSRRGQDYVTDSTNADTRLRRNCIRHRLLPLLREINPAADETLNRTMHHLAEAEAVCDDAFNDWKEEAVRREAHGVSVAKAALSNSYFRHRLAEQYALPDSTFAALCRNDAGEGAYCEGPAHAACALRGRVEIQPLPPEEGDIILPLGGEVRCAAGHITTRIISGKELTHIPRTAACVAIDLDRTRGTLIIRPPRSGERFAPFGLRGTRLVSDFLTDLHLSRLSRRWERAVADDNGIVWMVGRRLDNRVAITGRTQRVLLMTVKR